MRTRDWRRAQRERTLNKWLRIRRSWQMQFGDPLDWARRMLGTGSLSIQGCLCCHRLRDKEGPRFSERRRLEVVE
jgi:hypothetical protein